MAVRPKREDQRALQTLKHPTDVNRDILRLLFLAAFFFFFVENKRLWQATFKVSLQLVGTAESEWRETSVTRGIWAIPDMKLIPEHPRVFGERGCRGKCSHMPLSPLQLLQLQLGALSGWNSLPATKSQWMEASFKFSLWNPTPKSSGLGLLPWSPPPHLNCRLLFAPHKRFACLPAGPGPWPEMSFAPLMNLQPENLLFWGERPQMVRRGGPGEAWYPGIPFLGGFHAELHASPKTC